MLKKYLVGIILAFSVLSVLPMDIAFARETRVRDIYDLNLVIYKNGTAVISSQVTAGSGIISEFSPSQKYSIRILSDRGEELFREGLMVSFYRPMPFNGDADLVTLHVRVPCLEKATYLVVTQNQTDILKINLSSDFCDVDGICDTGENGYNCGDCFKEGGDKLGQPPLRLNQDWIPIILLFAVIAGVAVYMNARQKKEIELKNQELRARPQAKTKVSRK